MKPTNEMPPSLPQTGGVPATSDAKKPTARDGCFGCLGLIICALFVAMLFDKYTGKNLSDLSLDEQITSVAEDVFGEKDSVDVTPQVDGGYVVHVKWSLTAGLRPKTARFMIFDKVCIFLTELQKADKASQVLRFWFDPQITVWDKYGVKSVVPGAKIIIPRETVEKVQWKDFNGDMLTSLAEAENMVTWHPLMQNDG